jgi:hypothetical protein
VILLDAVTSMVSSVWGFEYCFLNIYMSVIRVYVVFTDKVNVVAVP